jgi:hypothetical protein
MAFSLSDSQLEIVMTAASAIEPDRRSVYLQRCAAMLNLRRRFDDSDVIEIVGLAAGGLTHQRTDAELRITVAMASGDRR